jgi:predicted Rossmann-fold nucleotide-binding protein
MKALVCGGRNFDDKDLVYEALDRISPSVVITGGATGADSLAVSWAMRRGVHYRTYPAEWGKYGAAAGPMRNQKMFDEEDPDVVIAFPGGRGTADTLRRAYDNGADVIIVSSREDIP